MHWTRRLVQNGIMVPFPWVVYEFNYVQKMLTWDGKVLVKWHQIYMLTPFWDLGLYENIIRTLKTLLVPVRIYNIRDRSLYSIQLTYVKLQLHKIS